jgi:hypothetical protein
LKLCRFERPDGKRRARPGRRRGGRRPLAGRGASRTGGGAGRGGTGPPLGAGGRRAAPAARRRPAAGAGGAAQGDRAGYTCANDVSVRDWQGKAKTMTIGKSFDTHGPLGPVAGDRRRAGRPARPADPLQRRRRRAPGLHHRRDGLRLLPAGRPSLRSLHPGARGHDRQPAPPPASPSAASRSATTSFRSPAPSPSRSRASARSPTLWSRSRRGSSPAAPTRDHILKIDPGRHRLRLDLGFEGWRGPESNRRHHDFQLPQPFSSICGCCAFPC